MSFLTPLTNATALPGEPVGAPPCAGCARLEQDPAPTVTMLTGHVVCTSCPAWLEETRQRQHDAYYVLGLTSKEARQAHLRGVEAQRGKLARERLEAVVMQTWEARRSHGTRSTKA